MIRLLLPLLLFIFIVWAIKHAKALPAPARRAFWLKVALLFAAAALVALTITGRMHWLGAVIAASLPLAGRAINLAMKFLPLWIGRKQKLDQNSPTGDEPPKEQPSTTYQSTMSAREAEDILGLSGTSTKEDIIEAHKKLMQRVHPDRGGSDHLAAKVNQAKDTLLNNLAD